MTVLRLLCVLMLSLGLSGLGAHAQDNADKGATVAAATWLGHVDAGDYAASWQEASSYLRGAVTEEAWGEALNGRRKPLGPVASRTLQSAHHNKSIPGTRAPDGDYVFMQFETSFENKKAAVETVTFVQETDGKWRAAGYFIKPREERGPESAQERKMRERRAELLKEATQLRAAQAERMKQAPPTAQEAIQAAPRTQQAPAPKALSTPQELEWDRLIKAGEAAYEKRDLSTGAKHFLAALQLAQTFDSEGDRNGNGYEVTTFQKMGDPLKFYTIKEAMRDQAVLKDNQEAYGKFISQRTKTVYAALEPFLKDALSLTEKVRGPQHNSVPMALENLAKCYDHLGRYQEAVPLYERIFVLSENYFGQPPEIKLEPSGIGFDRTYFMLRIRGAAWTEAALKHMMQVSEKAHGPDHPEIAVAVAYLSHLYEEQGRTAEAANLDQKARLLAEKAQGAESPKSIDALFSQASNVAGRGNYAEAEKLYLEALRLTEKSYGPEDVKDLHAFQRIAHFYEEQGRHAEAETYYQKYLQLTEKLYRPNDQQVYGAVSGLAQYYFSQKRYADAAPLYERALALVEKNRGHGSGLLELDRLAQTYLSLGRRAEAEPLFKRALVMVEKTNDPAGRRSRYLVLGEIALAKGHVDEAEQLYTRALDARVNTAYEDPETLDPRGKLADFYFSQKRYAEAEALYKKNLELAEAFHKISYSEQVNPLTALVDFYTSQNQFAEAESLLKSVLEKFRRSYGGRPETAALRQKLVDLLLTQGRKAEADALLNQPPGARVRPGVRP